MGPVGTLTVVPLESAEAVPLPGGSWSRMLVTAGRAPGARASLGVSRFAPGSETAAVRHQVEEVAYVVSGQGEIRLEARAVPCRQGDALHIPAGLWHAVANTGAEDLVMVFGFPHPDYPPSERRPC